MRPRQAGRVDTARVVRQHRQAGHRRRFSGRVPGHEVPQGPHGLGAQVPAPQDVVVDHRAQAPGLVPTVVPIQVIHQRRIHGHVGHLPADHPRLRLHAVYEGPDLRHQAALHFLDEAGPLVVEDLRLVQSLQPAVLGVKEGGVQHRKQAGHRREGHLRWNQVEALLLQCQRVLSIAWRSRSLT
jgi:hypothetical protein